MARAKTNPRFPKSFRAAMTRLRNKARKATTIDDLAAIQRGTYRAYEKARAEVYPVDMPLLDEMNDETIKVHELARESIKKAEAAYRDYLDSELRRLKEEERERRRGHWSNL